MTRWPNQSVEISRRHVCSRPSRSGMSLCPFVLAYEMRAMPHPRWSIHWAALALAVFLACPVAAMKADAPHGPGRSRVRFDQDWRFFKGDPEGAEVPGFDDSGWGILSLPHDWGIEGPMGRDHPSRAEGGFFPLGTGWYRKPFTLKPESRGQKVFIQFDGIHKNSDVWINGHPLGNRWYGYVSFQYDLTPYLRWDGTNVLAVRVDNRDQTSRWYTGSGIYRHVWLTLPVVRGYLWRVGQPPARECEARDVARAGRDHALQRRRHDGRGHGSFHP